MSVFCCSIRKCSINLLTDGCFLHVNSKTLCHDSRLLLVRGKSSTTRLKTFQISIENNGAFLVLEDGDIGFPNNKIINQIYHLLIYINQPM